MAKTAPHQRTQKGMTMLEVVVTMLVVGLGIVASVSMLQTSLRFGETAELKSMAIAKIEQISDSMRVNSLGLADYRLNHGQTKEIDWTLPTTKPTPTCTPPTTCTHQQYAKETAAQDLYTWTSDIAQTFPDGRAQIKGGDKGRYTITIAWRFLPESGRVEDSTSLTDAERETLQKAPPAYQRIEIVTQI